MPGVRDRLRERVRPIRAHRTRSRHARRWTSPVSNRRGASRAYRRAARLDRVDAFRAQDAPARACRRRCRARASPTPARAHRTSGSTGTSSRADAGRGPRPDSFSPPSLCPSPARVIPGRGRRDEGHAQRATRRAPARFAAPGPCARSSGGPRAAREGHARPGYSLAIVHPDCHATTSRLPPDGHSKVRAHVLRAFRPRSVVRRPRWPRDGLERPPAGTASPPWRLQPLFGRALGTVLTESLMRASPKASREPHRKPGKCTARVLGGSGTRRSR
jgi:hypothetical protein